MADSQSYSRIYELKTSGVAQVLADVNSVISRLEVLGKVKNQVGGADVGNPKMMADFNKQMEALIANVEKAAATNANLANSESHVTMNMQQSTAALGDNLTATTAAVTKQQSFADAVRKTAAELVADAKVQTEASKQATEEAKQAAIAFKAEAEASLISTKEKILSTRESERKEKQTEREIAAQKRLESSYGQLNKEYKEAAVIAKDLGAQMFMLERALLESGEAAANNPEYLQLAASMKAAQEKAAGLHAGLLKIDQAVGQSQRNVGNYSSATFAMTQILREAPSFAYNFATGLLAISNNLPILIDEISRLNLKNKELVAAGQKPVSVIGEMSKAIFSLNGILTIGMAALTIYFARMGTGAEKTKDLTERVKELDHAAQAQAQSEISNARILLSVAQDVKQAQDIRLRAVDDLQRKYPDYLGNLSKEAILTGQTADAMERLNAALLNKALAEASASKVSEAAKKYVELNEELREAEKNLTRLSKDKVNPNLSEKEQKEERGLIEANIIAAKGRVTIVKNEMAEILKEMDRFQKEANAFAAKAAPLMVSQPDKAKKEKTKEFLDSYKDLADALAALSTAQVQDEADKNKAIADNEKNALGERLQAIKNYYDDLGVIADIQYKKVIADEEEKKKELDRKKKEGKITAGDFKNEVGASNTRVDAAKQVYDNTIAGNAQNLSQATSKIYNDEVTKLNKYLAQELLAYQTAQDQELLLLSQMYARKEITDKEYAERKKQLLNKYNLDYLNATVDYLEKEIALGKLDADAQKKLIDELAAYKKKVLEAEIKANEDTAQNKKFDVKKIYSGALDVLNSFLQAEMELLARQDAYRDRVTQRQIDYNRKVRDSQVQSMAEKRANEKADFIQDQALEQQKMQREKKRAENQLLLNLVVASGKNFAEHSFYEALIIEGVLLGEFAAQKSMLSRVQAYKFGKDPNTHLAWVGDGGEPELRQLGNSWSVTPSEPTLTYVHKDERITPFSMIGNLGGNLKAPSFGGGSGGSVNSSGGGTNYDATLGALMGMVEMTNRAVQNIQINYNPTKANRANNINYFSTVKL